VATPLGQTFLEKVWLTLSFQMEAVSSFLLKLFFEKSLVNAFFFKKKGLINKI